jgi:hypothetical protein
LTRGSLRQHSYPPVRVVAVSTWERATGGSAETRDGQACAKQAAAEATGPVNVVEESEAGSARPRRIPAGCGLGRRSSASSAGPWHTSDRLVAFFAVRLPLFVLPPAACGGPGGSRTLQLVKRPAPDLLHGRPYPKLDLASSHRLFAPGEAVVRRAGLPCSSLVR